MYTAAILSQGFCLDKKPLAEDNVPDRLLQDIERKAIDGVFSLKLEFGERRSDGLNRIAFRKSDGEGTSPIYFNIVELCELFGHCVYARACVREGEDRHTPNQTIDDLNLRTYNTVLLFATGIGIAPQLPYVRQLLTEHYTWIAKTRRIALFWETDSECKCLVCILKPDTDC
jgi:hypothetical protein